jgi:hypothetical protein
MRRDWDEDALTDDEEDEDDPNNPLNPDWDLSESAPHYWEPPPKPWFTRRWVLLIVAFFVIASLLIPYIQRF